MEEIKLDPRLMSLFAAENENLGLLMNESKKGPLIGMPWNSRVYDYLFESGLSGDEINMIFALGGFCTADGYEPEEEEEEL